MSVPLPPLNLNSTQVTPFASGSKTITTGGSFNFSKPATAGGIDASFNAGWLVWAGVGLAALLIFKRKGGG